MMVLKQDENTRIFVTIGLVVLSSITYFFVWMFTSRGSCPVEHFAEEQTEQTDPKSISGILGNIQRISGVLLQPSTWTERIEMYSMTPVELARRYMNKSKASSEEDE